MAKKTKRLRWKSVAKYLIPFTSLVVILSGAYFAVQIGKGYRPSKEGLTGTGLLAANSFPPGAEVYLNDKLTTATDDTLNLPPGNYDITIKKDGYTPWKKTIQVQEELVTQTNASLFRAVPGLSPLTLSGATNITPSPDGQKIAFAVASASAEAKNGLYIAELNTSPLPGNVREPRQIARNADRYDLMQAQLLWSPNSTQILAHFPARGESTETNLILETSTLNEVDTLRDVTARLPIILREWEEEIAIRETKQFLLLPQPMQSIATQSATNVYFSPNEEKIMYTATEYTALPDQISPPLPASNTQPQQRDLEPDSIYVYDIKEDKNFQLATDSVKTNQAQNTKEFLLLSDYQQSFNTDDSLLSTQSSQVTENVSQLFDDDSFESTMNNFKLHYSSIYANHLQWFPDSNHILVKNQNSIDIVAYDNTNRITLYAGPFQDNFVYPWPDGTKLIILTNLNANGTTPENLYTIDIK